MKSQYQADTFPQSFAGGAVDTLPASPDAALNLTAQEAEFKLQSEYVLFGGMVALAMGEESDGRVLSNRALSFTNVTGEISGEPISAPGVTYRNFALSGAPVTARIAEQSNVLIVGTDSESINDTRARLRTMPHPAGIAQTARIETGSPFEQLAHEAYLNNGYDFVVGYGNQDALTVIHPQSRSVNYLGALAQRNAEIV